MYLLTKEKNTKGPYHGVQSHPSSMAGAGPVSLLLAKERIRHVQDASLVSGQCNMCLGLCSECLDLSLGQLEREEVDRFLAAW